MSRRRQYESASERAAASEARRLAAGGRNVRVVLNASAAAALQRLTDSGMTATAAIEQALLAASPPTRARVAKRDPLAALDAALHTDDVTP